MTQHHLTVPAPSPLGSNRAQLFLPAERFGYLATPQGAYDSVNGLGASKLVADAHRAVVHYLRPKMSRHMSFEHHFNGVTPSNFRRSIPTIVDRIVRETSDALAQDADPVELTRRLEEVGPNNPTERGTGDKPEQSPLDEKIRRLRAYLSDKVRPDVLDACIALVSGGDPKYAPVAPPEPVNDPEMIGEDAMKIYRTQDKVAADQRAKENFLKRYPDAARIGHEPPDYKNDPPKRPTPQPSYNGPSFYERFPGARRIGQA